MSQVPINYLDPIGSSYQNEALMELGDRYRYMDGLETVFEQNWLVYGAYRPHRFLPALYVSLQDQEGYVIPHGTVVSVENLKKPGIAGQTYPDGSAVPVYDTFNPDAGIAGNGYFNYGVGRNGSALSQSTNELYGYDITLDGVILPANGTIAAINDNYTFHDLTIQRVRPDGQYVTPADIAAPNVALTRQPVTAVTGVMHHQVIRETQGHHMSYRLYTAAISVCRYGVLNIPYVIMDANTIANPTKGDLGYDSVFWKHQFLTIDPAVLPTLRPEMSVRIDGNGKLTLPANPANNPVEFGRILSFTNETFPDLMSKVDGFPGLHVPGTNTGGLTRRLFDLVKRIREARGLTTDIRSIVNDVRSGYYGYVKVMFNTMGMIS